MREKVSLEIRSRCAVLKIANAPVNGISLKVRSGLFDGMRAAIANPQVAAVIIAGEGAQFSAGADIRQFNTPASTTPPLTRDLHALIATSPKPIVAAIHGYALGGALELALGCHFRVATSVASLGLPEVKLGLIPGGGGTQRLPRLIGLAPALDMIQTGNAIDGVTARASGLVDMLVEGDIIESTLPLALGWAAIEGHLPLATHRQLNSGGFDFEARMSTVMEHSGNAKAQRAAIKAVEAGTHLGFELAITRERALFDELVLDPESAALRQAFFAGRR